MRLRSPSQCEVSNFRVSSLFSKSEPEGQHQVTEGRTRLPVICFVTLHEIIVLINRHWSQDVHIVFRHNTELFGINNKTKFNVGWWRYLNVPACYNIQPITSLVSRNMLFFTRRVTLFWPMTLLNLFMNINEVWQNRTTSLISRSYSNTLSYISDALLRIRSHVSEPRLTAQVTSQILKCGALCCSG